MTRWEYQDCGEDGLPALGLDGWEAFAACRWEDTDRDGYKQSGTTFYLKRRVSQVEAGIVQPKSLPMTPEERRTAG